ncbi:MAG TPA: metallophosphoesterase [Polyangiaceae bacterium]|nr:metallophosphoesterase [Polyangiaceae bacterium]
MQRWLRRGLFLAALLAIALGVDALFVEPARLVVNRQELKLPNWPAELSGLRVAFLSDLHVGSPHWGLSRLHELVQQVNAEQPDLILLGGDYLINGVWFGNHVEAEPIALELGQLRAPLGVYAVLGNHDWWNDGPKVRAAFEAHGVTVLDDEVRRLHFKGKSVCLLGVRDETERLRSARKELELALPGMPLLVLMHEPDLFDDFDERATLTLAGHTHGGQVDLPVLGRRVVPSRFGPRYAAGHIVENERHLFVTTGVGTSIIPVRFRVPPEIALLTLR